MVLVPKIKIERENWKNLLLGLQKELSLTQIGLLKKLGLKSNSRMSIWLSGKSTPLKQTQPKILNFIFRNELDFKKLIQFGKQIRNSLEFNNEFIPLDFAVQRSYFGDNLFLEIDNKKYLNVPLVFPASQYKQPLEFILKDEEVIVFYKYKFARSLFPLKLPMLLELNETFLVGLGIYLGEGARNRRPKITNSTPLIVKQAIKFFGLFNFNNNDLSAWIQLHERSEKSLNQVQSYWLSNTSLFKKNIREIRIKKSTGSAEIEQFGTLHLEINYVLFQIFINNLLMYIPKLLSNLSEQELVWFLQGVYAGEGYVSLAKSGSVNIIKYTSKRKEERKLIAQILKKLNITSKETTYDIDIYGYENLIKIYELDIFAYHPDRKEKFQKGLICLTNSHIPHFNKNKILNLLRINKYLTVVEIANFLNLTYGCVKKHMIELYKDKKISKISCSGKIPSKWYII